MRCSICNVVINSPQWNRDHEEWDPCLTCLEIIDSVFEDYVTPDMEVPDEDDEKILEDFPYLKPS